MMKNCFECTHRQVSFSDLGKIPNNMLHVRNQMYVACGAGNHEKIRDYHIENGGKPYGEVTGELDCFEDTAIGKCLTRLNKLLDEELNKKAE